MAGPDHPGQPKPLPDHGHSQGKGRCPPVVAVNQGSPQRGRVDRSKDE